MEYKKLSHAVYHCYYHIVLPTKYRRAIFNDGVFAFMKEKLLEITKQYPSIEVKEINHDKDYIHMQVSIPPRMAVGQFVRVFKANTSRGLKTKFPFLKDVYWGADGIWSDGYFVSTTGINDEVIAKYIRMQGAEDSGQATTLVPHQIPRS
mgnify:CR=1 FL=1